MKDVKEIGIAQEIIFALEKDVSDKEMIIEDVEEIEIAHEGRSAEMEDAKEEILMQMQKEDVIEIGIANEMRDAVLEDAQILMMMIIE